ncbi:unnamed protein product [Paramecium octaurelia]|uniref:Uncharacterized protein n=1 Tax=Paramecium octaurelia TaxID=43137 RepID=A0A8S1T2Y5_PAROT|nr:unnamed protein product [Paramecium octaurelia]
MRQKDRQKSKGKYLSISKELVQIVDVHGGPNCKNWGQVARHLEAQVGIKIEKAYRLKRAWESFVDYNENMSKEQLATLFETAIKTRGNMEYAKHEFKRLTGIQLYSTRYADYVKTWLKPGLLGFKDCYIFSVVKSLRRSDFYQKHTMIQPITVLSMLRILDHDIEEYKDDFFVMDFRDSAERLQELLKCYASCFSESREERYSKFSRITTRHQFKKIYFYLQLMEEFRRINRFFTSNVNQLTFHPMLFKTIDQNKQCPIYKLTLLENDYSRKLQLFNESNNNENEQFSVLLKPKKKRTSQKSGNDEEKNKQKEQQNPYVYQLEEEDLVKQIKVPKKVSETKKKYKDYRYFRGHFIRDGQYQCKGLTTKDFEYDVPLEQ